MGKILCFLIIELNTKTLLTLCFDAKNHTTYIKKMLSKL